MRIQKQFIRSLMTFAGVALVAGCGAGYEPGAEDFADYALDDAMEEEELASVEQDLSASCGGDDSNALSAALAVAIGNELGRWDVNTDFRIANGKLELSPTGKLHCGSNCKNIDALLRLQDDASSVITNHSPSTYRSKLTSWYNTQKNTLTQLVDKMLHVDQGIYRIRSLQSGKYIVPQNGSTASGALLQQSDRYSSTTAVQWRVRLEGTHRQIVNVKSGLCMDLKSNTSGSTNIVQRPCSSAATQDFRIGQLGPNELTIRSTYNQAFMPQNSSSANNANIMQGAVKGAHAEKFVFERYGSGPHRDLQENATAVYSMKVAHTGMGFAVSSASTNDGVNVVQQPYNASDDRFHWYLTQIGTATVNNVPQTTYQLMNRRTGKCLDLDNSYPKRLIQRTCSTAWTQRFLFTNTGNLRNVMYTVNGYTVDVENGSSASGARVVEGRSNTWQNYNMITFDPLIAIEPHRLRFNRKERGGPCGDYYWYDITKPNGQTLADPRSTYVQLIFAGGKQTASGSDVNPFIAQKVSGNQVAIDPTYGLISSSSTSSGTCTAACLKISTASMAGKCCSCNGKKKKFARSAWSGTTYVCQ